MFAWLAAHVVGLLWRRSARLMLRLPAQQAALFGGVLLAALYALFSGWGVPSQRTVWMLATVALLRLTGRRWPWPNVWLLTAAVVVALDPWALMQAGFWLSFVAVGVLFATDAGMPGEQQAGGRSAAALLPRAMDHHAGHHAAEPAAVPAGVADRAGGQCGGDSLGDARDHALAMLGVAVPPLWDAAAWAVHALALLLQWMAGLPHATLSMAAPPLWMAACGVGGGVFAGDAAAVVAAQPWRSSAPAGAAVAGAPACGGRVRAARRRHRPGQRGARAHRHTQPALRRRPALQPRKRRGPPRAGAAAAGLRRAARHAGGEPSRCDHIGGAPAVLAMQPEAELLSSIEATHPLQAMRALRRCEAGQSWSWDGVRFEVLHPFESDYRSFGKPNAVSCVLRVDNGRAAALLAGDIERLQEAALVVRTPQLLHADVLLAPHHGSKTSSGRLSSTRSGRASCSCRRGTATASAIRPGRWSRATSTGACG
ncbi:competence protein domain-containing protein [Ditylenchus destructor]|uniref:Competence protein domain-containing protein n=1 Tax=Ditylenchus destructor TaxID=166010 RepID=A0AAD4ME48_9BILA|nr:competence protein domain-containing protein [Ditylenchus destructor]